MSSYTLEQSGRQIQYLSPTIAERERRSSTGSMVSNSSQYMRSQSVSSSSSLASETNRPQDQTLAQSPTQEKKSSLAFLKRFRSRKQSEETLPAPILSVMTPTNGPRYPQGYPAGYSQRRRSQSPNAAPQLAGPLNAAKPAQMSYRHSHTLIPPPTRPSASPQPETFDAGDF